MWLFQNSAPYERTPGPVHWKILCRAELIHRWIKRDSHGRTELQLPAILEPRPMEYMPFKSSWPWDEGKTLMILGGGERPKQEAQDQPNQAAAMGVDMTNLASVLLFQYNIL